ncbi:hypothetical protein OE766_00070 [Pararhizobium sp. YC-54]|uniref:hypothetical protein n=1 Tax=Pararhizobium sp. YC-54 TaxID=2986920 RepID=UPI0021F7635A|nr:hypothetical protein [Pararhizobium sp. YC-54]MCV9996639.1 hypothetical protein [Pararhizobium sp. YC-54]
MFFSLIELSVQNARSQPRFPQLTALPSLQRAEAVLVQEFAVAAIIHDRPLIDDEDASSASSFKNILYYRVSIQEQEWNVNWKPFPIAWKLQITDTDVSIR